MSLSEISKFFTEKSLDEIIIKAGGTKHTSFKFGKGFKKGDSYLSKVFRLCVYGEHETLKTKQEINLIIKSMPDNLARRKLFRSADFFRNEIYYYTKVIPALEEFQKSKNPLNPFTEYPKCYLCHCDGENDFIALEDVSFLGYGSPNRQDYISIDECRITMRTMGRLHGIGLTFADQEPKAFSETMGKLEETYYGERIRSWYMGFLRLAITVAKDAVSKTYPGTKYETIVNKYLQEGLYSDQIKIVGTRGKFSSVCHGDCWTPNFLTKYREDGSPEAVKVIDYQLTRCASIALDISFFIYSCTSQELREKHYLSLLKDYHDSACALIKDLGSNPDKVLTFEELLAELKAFGRFGCGMGIESLPMSLIEDDEVADLDAIQENAILTDVWNITPFKEEAKRKRIADIFKHAIDQEYIQ
ncbi:uncharacterized protein LOC129908231 isoform X2 [Episyrphus balteatus]|nr:uncharacterized protein LOC129908231 isoform X2 [Episyrphus balteatus]